MTDEFKIVTTVTRKVLTAICKNRIEMENKLSWIHTKLVVLTARLKYEAKPNFIQFIHSFSP